MPDYAFVVGFMFGVLATLFVGIVIIIVGFKLLAETSEDSTENEDRW